MKRLNKLLNSDLKILTNWLNANKISLHVSKTELIIFKPKRKPLDFNMKIKLNGKRLYPTDSVKYLGVKIDSKLNWKSLMVIKTWNDTQREMKGAMLNTFSLVKLKSLLIEFCLNMYKTS